MGRPTVHDIAKAAGVSLATVDRVLNARPGVREKTARLVHDAVERLGYVRDTYAANLARQRQYRFLFVLPEGGNQFVEALRLALREATEAHQADRVLVKVVHVATYDPHAVVRTLDALKLQRVDGVALMVPETPQVRDAVARLKAAGLSVVALVSDLPNSPRDHFVGIDNRAAGRTAGMLMGRFLGGRAGKVAVLVNTTQARDTLERRGGFDEIIAGQFPALETLPSLEGHDDHLLAAAVVARCLDHHGPVIGFYSAGGGTRGLTRVLAERGLAGSGLAGRVLADRTVVIAHELTPHSRQALAENVIDAIIAQNVGHLVRSALRVLRAKCDGVPIFAAQERIRIDIVIRENLP